MTCWFQSSGSKIINLSYMTWLLWEVGKHACFLYNVKLYVHNVTWIHMVELNSVWWKTCTSDFSLGACTCYPFGASWTLAKKKIILRVGYRNVAILFHVMNAGYYIFIHFGTSTRIFTMSTIGRRYCWKTRTHTHFRASTYLWMYNNHFTTDESVKTFLHYFQKGFG